MYKRQFLQRAYDQILHDVCLQNLPVVFAIDRAGLVGEDGPTHQGVFDLSYLRHIPRLVIASPKDTAELRDLVATALKHDGPMAFRYPRGAGPSAYEPGEARILSIGRGERIAEGEDAAIIAVGSTVYPSIAAAESLAEHGVSVEVINARFVKPLDEQLILDVFERKLPIVVVEDNTIVGGFGSAVVELAAGAGCSVDCVRRVGVPDVFPEHDSPETLRQQFGLTASQIVQEVRAVVAQREMQSSRDVAAVRLRKL